jgi:hypothetical protein
MTLRNLLQLLEDQNLDKDVDLFIKDLTGNAMCTIIDRVDTTTSNKTIFIETTCTLIG